MKNPSRRLIPRDSITPLLAGGAGILVFYREPAFALLLALAIYALYTGLMIRSADIFALRGSGSRFDSLWADSGMSRKSFAGYLRRREGLVLLDDLATIIIMVIAVAAMNMFGFLGLATMLLIWPVQRILRRAVPDGE